MCRYALSWVNNTTGSLSPTLESAVILVRQKASTFSRRRVPFFDNLCAYMLMKVFNRLSQSFPISPSVKNLTP